MKILAVSDEESTALWDSYTPGKLDEYDLILACGNLKAEYLSFLVTMARGPVLYVHGDRDGDYRQSPPEGCDCIDGQLVVYNGLRILGLGGCLRYQSGSHQYTDAEMARRVAKLHYKIKRLGGLDVVVTHAPPVGEGEKSGDCQGFPCFRELMELYRPKYLVHGHVRPGYSSDGFGIIQRQQTYLDTTVINACGRYDFDAPDNPFKEKHRYNIIWKTKHKN